MTKQTTNRRMTCHRRAIMRAMFFGALLLPTTDSMHYREQQHQKLCGFQLLLHVSPSTRRTTTTTTSRRTTTCRRYQDETLHDGSSSTPEVEIAPPQQTYDPITDWHPPSPTMIQETIQQRITPLVRLTSPVFFSTNHLGQCVRGLGHLPSSTTSSPLLIVGNHQLGALDIWLIVPELIQERNIFVRGLGHAVIFNNQESHLKGGPTFLPDQAKQGTFGLYQKFGACMATPKNLYRLLQTNQTVLHFPGGAREAYHGRDEAYQLFWPQTDFVRMAAKFNATIVPLSGIGAADSVKILVNPEEMLKLPLGMSSIVANSFLTVREATRYDELHKKEPYIRPPPLIVPKLLPARHYFVFGRPFDTTQLDPRNREACRRLYHEVQTELYRGLDDLLRAREYDPFKDSTKRFVYEQVTGKQAPTFSIKELHSS